MDLTYFFVVTTFIAITGIVKTKIIFFALIW